jgi:hypothetical protein
MVTLGEKGNILELSTSMSSVLDHALTNKSMWNILLSWVVYLCDMVTLGGKGIVLEPRNLISILISSVLDLLTSKSREHPPSMGCLYMCDMVILGGVTL